MISDIKFAKDHMGEYFQYEGRKVRVIGYDAVGIGPSVIIDYRKGWGIKPAVFTEVIHEDLCETGRGYYVHWEELM